jgi:hypothetical protein
MSGWGTLHSSIRSSSLLTEPIETRWLFVFMLSQADRIGFVTGSLPGLAHQANLPVETTRKALEALMAPDTESRTKEQEGRRVKKVDDGWLILNYRKYRGNALYRNRNGNGAAPAPSNGEQDQTRDKRERERVKANSNSNSETLPNREAPQNSAKPVLRDSRETRETWSPAERAAYESRPSDTHRRFFEIARGFAESAASNDKPDFPLATGPISKKLGITEQGAGKIRSQFVTDGIIERTEKYDYREGKAARYRWTLETTIPVPAMPEEQASDLDGEPF